MDIINSAGYLAEHALQSYSSRCQTFLLVPFDFQICQCCLVPAMWTAPKSTGTIRSLNIPPLPVFWHTQTVHALCPVQLWHVAYVYLLAMQHLKSLLQHGSLRGKPSKRLITTRDGPSKAKKAFLSCLLHMTYGYQLQKACPHPLLIG